MDNYKVFIPIGATAMIDVEADSKEEAIRKAIEEIGNPSICHQCSNEIEIGEFYDEDKAIAQLED